ncbi:MAG: STAS domain-containing protein [Fibrobacterota bacterium]|nr:STAS domain-containing protein [Fibrobacterota bacterium]QQS04649.1 MAG: STAS domain-containing protein [Fibrobacterota bacterium]
MLDLTKIEEGARILITLQGVANLRSTSELKRMLADATEDTGIRQVVLDMSGVEMLDSAVLGILLAHHQKLQRRGGELVLLSPSDEMTDLLVMTDLEQLIPVYATRELLPAAVA